MAQAGVELTDAGFLVVKWDHNRVLRTVLFVKHSYIPIADQLNLILINRPAHLRICERFELDFPLALQPRSCALQLFIIQSWMTNQLCHAGVEPPDHLANGAAVKQSC